MRKVWALVDFGDTIVGQPFETEEAAQRTRDSMSYLGEMLEIREIDYNDEPLDEEGHELKQKLVALFEEKKILNLHMSKGVSFYAQPLKERYRLILNTLDEVNGFPRTPLDFGDRTAPKSDVEPRDVKEWVRDLDK